MTTEKSERHARRTNTTIRPAAAADAGLFHRALQSLDDAIRRFECQRCGTEQINAPSAAEVPGEFYYDKNNSNATYHPYTTYPRTLQAPAGVVLNKLAVDPNGVLPSSPVFRMIFVNDGLPYSTVPAVGATTPDPRMLDPDDPVLSSNSPNFASYVDRIAYFVGAAAGSPPASPLER